jgi:hypothetical protein
MPDFSLPNSVTLVFGQSGSGKTSFAVNYLLNTKVACRFCFDWKEGEISRRVQQRLVATRKDCEEALPSRWVCFSPHLSSNRYDALRWFAGWSTEVSQRGPGPKIFYVDEMWKFTDAHNVAPEEVEDIVRGVYRAHGLQFLSSTQHPRDYHRSIRAEVTEWVCFNTIEPGDLDAVRPYFAGVDEAATLPKGKFIAYNRDSGGISSGQLETGWPPGKFIKVRL